MTFSGRHVQRYCRRRITPTIHRLLIGHDIKLMGKVSNRIRNIEHLICPGHATAAIRMLKSLGQNDKGMNVIEKFKSKTILAVASIVPRVKI